MANLKSQMTNGPPPPFRDLLTISRLPVIRIAPEASRLRRIAEEEDQQHARDETADVSHKGHPSAGAALSQRAESADELQRAPEADDDQRRQFGDYSELDDAHALSRKQNKIRPQNARDRSRSAQRRDLGIRAEEDVRCAGQKSAKQIKDQVLQVSHPVFDVVPEYPQVEHVAAEVQPSPMHK